MKGETEVKTWIFCIENSCNSAVLFAFCLVTEFTEITIRMEVSHVISRGETKTCGKGRKEEPARLHVAYSSVPMTSELAAFSHLTDLQLSL